MRELGRDTMHRSRSSSPPVFRSMDVTRFSLHISIMGSKCAENMSSYQARADTPCSIVACTKSRGYLYSDRGPTKFRLMP